MNPAGSSSPADEKRLRRVALKLFRRMTHPDAYLSQLDSSDWGLFAPDGRTGEPAGRIRVADLVALRSADLVRLDRNGRARLTDVGRKWTARQVAGADPFSGQHQERVVREIRVDEGAPAKALVNESESPLGWLRKRRHRNGRPLISDQQFLAGERLRRDFTAAQIVYRLMAAC